MRTPTRMVVVGAVAAYGVLRLARPLWWDLLDNFSLVVHEAGHMLFMFFGDHLHALGGSLLQVMVPLAFTVQFLRTKQPFSAAITLAWLGQNLCGVATYIGDARAQELPLLGGENVIHDWWYLLTEWDLLQHDQFLARMVRMLAAISFGAAAVLAARHVKAAT